jgi:membrane-bound lytic murein transglycosylase B
MALRNLLVGMVLVLLTFSASLAYGNDMPYGAWVAQLRQDALARGIPAQVFDAAMFQVMPDERVIRLDRKQPEGRLSWTEYAEKIVSADRVEKGQAKLLEHRAILEEISARYHVPKEIIVALWGVETIYGGYTGNFSIIEALATLAYNGRRADFFREELLNAMEIIAKNEATAEQMTGSWAGAMGQTQFMPSSYLKYAVSWENNGHPDIWTHLPDVFASIANYLQQSGWNGDEIWGLAVNLPPDFDPALADLYKPRPVEEWRKMGVTARDGGALPAGGLVYVMYPGGNNEGAYMVTENYHVLLKWNRSRYFATSVGLLSDRIAAK